MHRIFLPPPHHLLGIAVSPPYLLCDHCDVKVVASVIGNEPIACRKGESFVGRDSKGEKFRLPQENISHPEVAEAPRHCRADTCTLRPDVWLVVFIVEENPSPKAGLIALIPVPLHAVERRHPNMPH